MSRNVSLVLDGELARFVEAQVAKGRFGTPAEVVRAGLRLLEDREERLSALRAALIEGEESGPATPFDFEAFVAGKVGSESTSR